MRIDAPFPASFGFHLLLLDDLRDRTRRGRRTAVVTILRRGPGIVHPRLIVRVLLAQNALGDPSARVDKLWRVIHAPDHVRSDCAASLGRILAAPLDGRLWLLRFLHCR